MESHYVKIYSGNFVIVQLINSRLQAIGITPIIKDESESGRLAGFPVGMSGYQEVYVHEDEMDKAVERVEATLAEVETQN